MGTARILARWVAARRAMGRSAAGLERDRGRLWRGLQPALARTPALARFAGGPLDAFPVTEPAEMRLDLGRWTGLGLSGPDILAAATRAEAGEPCALPGGLVAGLSTGSVAARGAFLAGPEERDAYVGLSLARLLPARALLAGVRIALVLRAGSPLYGHVGRVRGFHLIHLPLSEDPARHAAALRAARPDVLIAPAHALAALARHQEATAMALPRLRRCFWGAEPMGEAERAWIAEALGTRPDPIYQATEGFLGAACRLGRLHLNDDVLAIEWEPVPGTSFVRPIVTDLQRTSLPVVRVRLDDLLEPDPRPCACGFAGRTVHPVAGRVGDLWRLGARVVGPAEVTRAMEAILGPSASWHARATPEAVVLDLDPAADAPSVARALGSLLDLPVPVEASGAPPPSPIPKRRRVSWSEAGP